MSDGPIRLLIADDHPVVRDGLSGIFESDPGFEVLGQAADGAQAVDLAERLGPDVVLMDLRMPGTDGLGAIAEIARRGLAARVLVLTTYDTDADVLPAIQAGATGYLLKDAPRTELLRRRARGGAGGVGPLAVGRQPRPAAASAGRRTTSPTTSAHGSWRSSSSSRGARRTGRRRSACSSARRR